MFRWRLTILIILIIVFSFVIYPASYFKPVKNFFITKIKPISTFGYETFGRFAIPFKKMIYLRGTIRQNSNLIQENLSLQSQIAKLTEVEIENEILKKELGFYQTQNANMLVSVTVVSYSETGYVKTLILDKGEKSGLLVGQGVVSQGFLVGLVSQVYKDSSEMTLITDFNSLVPVVLQNSRATGLLRGGLGGLIVEDIPLNAEYINGEKVVTSGLGGEIPQGILVGSVTGLISKDGEIFQRVSVSTPIDFSNLKILFVNKIN